MLSEEKQAAKKYMYLWFHLYQVKSIKNKTTCFKDTCIFG